MWTHLRKSGASKRSRQCASATQTWRARWKRSSRSSKNGPDSKNRNYRSLVVCCTYCDCRLGANCRIAVESFWQNGHFTLNHYRELISAARFWPLFGNSIRLALVTTRVRIDRCPCGNPVREIRPPAAFRIHVAAHGAVRVTAVLRCARLELASSRASEQRHQTGCSDSPAASLCFPRSSFPSPCS